MYYFFCEALPKTLAPLFSSILRDIKLEKFKLATLKTAAGYPRAVPVIIPGNQTDVVSGILVKFNNIVDEQEYTHFRKELAFNRLETTINDVTCVVYYINPSQLDVIPKLKFLQVHLDYRLEPLNETSWPKYRLKQSSSKIYYL